MQHDTITTSVISAKVYFAIHPPSGEEGGDGGQKLEEMQTLKHALGSFWESRPDQSAASKAPKLGSPWVQLCAYCRYWLLPHRDEVLRTAGGVA